MKPFMRLSMITLLPAVMILASFAAPVRALSGGLPVFLPFVSR